MLACSGFPLGLPAVQHAFKRTVHVPLGAIRDHQSCQQGSRASLLDAATGAAAAAKAYCGNLLRVSHCRYCVSVPDVAVQVPVVDKLSEVVQSSSSSSLLQFDQWSLPEPECH